MENPFFHRGPIRDREYFFDRRDELEQALMLLNKGQSISVVGPRRIGKTSFLLRMAGLRQHDFLPSQTHTAKGDRLKQQCLVYVDCQAWAHITPEELYAELAGALIDTLADQASELCIPSAITSSTDLLPFRTFDQLIRLVEQHGFQITFLLDEFDAIAGSPYIDREAFASLRSLATARAMRFVTASVQPLQSFTCTPGLAQNAPFFNFFVPLKLGLFTESEAIHMLGVLSEQAGMPFAPPICQWLLHLAGPHPLFLQIAAYCAYDQLMRTHELEQADSRERVRLAFLDEVAPHWRYAWNVLPDHEQHLLASLPLNWKASADVLRRLELEGLVVRRSPATVTWLSPEFQSFVARQPVTGLKQIPPVTMDCQRRAVLVRGQVVDLPPAEFDLLLCLIHANGNITSHHEIENHIWNAVDIEGGERLKSTVKSLRRSLGEAAACVENVRGIGYRFNRLCE